MLPRPSAKARIQTLWICVQTIAFTAYVGLRMKAGVKAKYLKAKVIKA